MSEPVVVQFRVEAHPHVEVAEIDREEWDAMTPTERGVMLERMANTAVANAGGYGYRIVSGATDADVT